MVGGALAWITTARPGGSWRTVAIGRAADPPPPAEVLHHPAQIRLTGPGVDDLAFARLPDDHGTALPPALEELRPCLRVQMEPDARSRCPRGPRRDRHRGDARNLIKHHRQEATRGITDLRRHQHLA